MSNEQMLELIRQMAPELLDRALQADNPIRAVLQAWLDARELRRAPCQPAYKP